LPDPARYRLPRNAAPSRYRLELRPDLEAAVFSGRALIDLELFEDSSTLVLNAAELELSGALLTTAAGERLTLTLELDPELEQARLTSPAPCPPGDGYRLELEFSGRLNDQLHGFYLASFASEQADQTRIALTQFEPTDARRAFPCWDEPDFKAVFEVSLVVPETLTALSNSALVRKEAAGEGLVRWQFAPTVRMSSYLVAFVVGPYELPEPELVGGVPLRVVTVAGKTELTSFAARAARFALEFLTSYFDIPYPGDKLDHVAVPDFAFGAMENLGCVLYRESLLVADPERASHLELQRVAMVISHETSHMWFGDLVTMRWWEGIWLNEAFATFMENTTVDAFEPSWEVWGFFGAGRAAAMFTDGLRSSRPVEFEVGAPEEAEAMFDVLTYQKGGSLLRMLEQHLGPEVFRAGVSR